MDVGFLKQQFKTSRGGFWKKQYYKFNSLFLKYSKIDRNTV